MILKNKKFNCPLFLTTNGLLFFSDIVNALKAVGVKKGDVIFVHSDVSVFGKLAISDRAVFLGNLVDSLETAVGSSGTIIMPTFTYSASRGKIFDIQNSPSTVGALTEFFRKRQGVIRTADPMFSVAIWGGKKKIFSQVGNDCFGKGSIFDKFHREKGKILFLGSRACTFFHYIERTHGVPYRFEKIFKGKIKKGNKIFESEIIGYVRRLKGKSVSHFSIAVPELVKKGLMKKINFGDSKIALIKADTLFKEVCRKLDKDPNYYLRSNLSEKEESTLT